MPGTDCGDPQPAARLSEATDDRAYAAQVDGYGILAVAPHLAYGVHANQRQAN
jgi:hypothetical protein